MQIIERTGMKTRQMANSPFKQIGIETGKGKYHEEIVYGIGLVYISMIHRISAYLKDYDLTPTDLNVLMLVKHQGKDHGISQVDLGQKLMVTAHNMTRAIQRLEKKGLLKRVSYKKDARVNLVSISPKGSKLLDDVWPEYNQMMRDFANALSVDEQKALAGLLQKWLNNKGA
jgi:DNA-binding MarR family transcriptional regulator